MGKGSYLDLVSISLDVIHVGTLRHPMSPTVPKQGIIRDSACLVLQPEVGIDRGEKGISN
jgi:hypothetical protein